MRKIVAILIICISIFTINSICVNNTFAEQRDSRDLIKDVKKVKWATKCGDHNNVWRNHSIIEVTFNWGSGCYDENGKLRCRNVENSFHCTEPGDKCTTTDSILDGNISIYRSQFSQSRKGYDTIKCKDNDEYVCYKVVIPAKKKFQDLKGWIQVDRRYRLTTKYIGIGKDCHGNEKMLTIADDTKSELVWRGGTATTYMQNIDNYRFLGWSKTKDKAGIIDSSSEYSTVLNKAETVYAIYEKINNVQDEDCDETVNCEEWTPADYYADKTAVVSKVLNRTIGTGFEDSVYAKPDDDILWKHCYFPGVQRKADDEATNKSSHNRDGTNIPAPYVYHLIQDKISNLIKWENKYTTDATAPDGFSTKGSHHSETFETGDTSISSYSDDTYSVEGNKVGNELREGITSGVPISVNIMDGVSHSWRCWERIVGYHNGSCIKYETTEDSDGNSVENCVEYQQIPDYDWETCSHAELYIDYTVDEGPATDDASVKVPYNFHNRTKIIDNGDEIVYAGGTETVTFDLKNLPKDNNVTQGTYATKSETKYKIRVCYGDGISADNSNYEDDGDDMSEGEEINLGDTCSESERSINLNPTSDADGVTEELQETINIPDINAGYGICIQSAVWARNSGRDTNWQLSEIVGDMSGVEYGGQYEGWSYSPTIACFTIAKKPSLQVWGGSLYTRSNIDTSVMVKGNIAGYGENSTYKVLGTYNERLFGSWAELGVITNGTVYGFASGASTGYEDNNNGVLIPNEKGGSVAQGGVGGTSETTTFCSRTPLTIANENCNLGIAGNMTTLATSNSATNDKDAIIAKMINGDAGIKTDNATLSYENNYYRNDEDMEVSGVNLNSGDLKVVYAEGNIHLSGDIKFEGTYTKYTEVPKVVIYAKSNNGTKGNVYIDCGVSRVDALIMADDTVYTCADASGYVPDENSSERSNQLVVNGAIIANYLSPDRTYGAAPGSNSMVSAEIINFDSTLYLWAGTEEVVEEGGETKNVVYGDLETDYIRELAPRR